MGRLRQQTAKGGLGGGASDIDGLTRWAAPRCSAEIRERALQAAIDFLEYPGHLLFERTRWLPFIAHLARVTPTMHSMAAEALIRAAGGGLSPSGAMDDFTNPFAFVRVKGHTAGAIREDAIFWLATLLPTADAVWAPRIVEVLSQATQDFDPAVRLAVVKGVSWALRQIGRTSEMAVQLRKVILEPSTRDKVQRVALIAYEALTPLWSEDS